MKKLKLMLDFGEGPIWTEYFDEEKGRLLTGIEKIDIDKELWDINETIQELFTSYYHLIIMIRLVFSMKNKRKKINTKCLTCLGNLRKDLMK